jgi:hypothetical protein
MVVKDVGEARRLGTPMLAFSRLHQAKPGDNTDGTAGSHFGQADLIGALR